MAREHRKDRQKLNRSRNHHKSSSKSHKPRRSSSPPLVRKSHKSQETSVGAIAASQPQFILLDEAGLNNLIAGIKGLSTQKDATSVNHVSNVITGEGSLGTAKSLKPKKIVSIGSLFGNDKRKLTELKKTQKAKERQLDSEAFVNFTHGLETAYTTIKEGNNANFDAIHAGFKKRIDAARNEDANLISFVAAVTEKLSMSLMDERLELELQRKGKLVKETVTIGDRIAHFKSEIARESAKLQQLWQEWEEVRQEYLELGVDIFGAVAMEVEDSGSVGRTRGFRQEIDELDADHDVAVKELNEQVEKVREETLKKLRSTEKELDLITKKEQEQLLRSCLLG